MDEDLKIHLASPTFLRPQRPGCTFHICHVSLAFSHRRGGINIRGPLLYTNYGSLLGQFTITAMTESAPVL